MKKLITMFLFCLMANVSFSGYANESIKHVHSKSKQCAAVTKKGKRCKRNAENGSIYCWQHNPNR